MTVSWASMLADLPPDRHRCAIDATEAEFYALPTACLRRGQEPNPNNASSQVKRAIT
jgi:hypothetical protein